MSIAIPSVPRCVALTNVGGTQCYSLLYTPGNDTFVTNIMNNVIANNNIPSNEVVSFNTPDEADYFISTNKGLVAAAVNVWYVGTELHYALQVQLHPV